MKKELPQGGLFLMLISPVSLFMSLTAQRWLPEQFLRDSSYVNERLNSSITGYTDSFSTITELYSLLTTSLNSTLLTIIQWSISVLPLILVSRIVMNPYRNFKSALIAGLYLFLIPVYLSSYSKEFIIVLSVNLALVLFWKFDNEKTRAYLFLVVLLSITIVRQYYFLTTLLTLMLVGILWRIKIDWHPILIVITATFVFTFEAFTRIIVSITGIDILNLRFNVVNNSPIRANSTIYPEVYSTSFFENLWSLIKAVHSVVIPFELSQINFYTIFATFVTWLFLYTFISEMMSSQNESPSVRVMSSFLFSFYVVALIFEPDVGSFNRHSFPWLPLILLLASTRALKSAKDKQ
jgi:hypothetical protein